MNRMMMERNVELAVGEAQDGIQERQKKLKAKMISTIIDARLRAEDTWDWAEEHTGRIQNMVRDGHYAISDALDDMDYALFQDNAETRKVALVAATTGLTLLVIALSALRIRRKLIR